MAQDDQQPDMINLEDDRPLAVRRKRRMSTGRRDSIYSATVQKAEDDDEQLPLASRTPKKPKKRVRFSDPGLNSSTASSSTGLTPHMKRTSFFPHGRGSVPSTPYFASGIRCSSLPAQSLNTLPSPSFSLSPLPFSGEVQFEPLRQLLDARSKRRLRRNGLSGEINDIEEEHKVQRSLRLEVRELRDQLQVAKDFGNEEHNDGGNEVDGEVSSEKVRELEQKIDEMKNQMRERSMTAESFEASAGASSNPGDITIFEDDNNDEFVPPIMDECHGLRDHDAIVSSPVGHEVGTQASLFSPAHTEAFRDARLALEYLFPGEITLGLVPEDPKPLLDTMVDRMRNLRAQALIAEDSLSITRAQESNLRIQFNAVLAQLDRARKHAETIHAANSNEKMRADTTQARVQMLENTLQAATNKVHGWEKDADEKERSIRKLQDALETYRVEVNKLETLITKMEGEHATALSGLRAEMDEAVADLECHVVAETRGRREAEHEAAEKDEKIKQLKRQELELKDALNEKQQIIRETEVIFQEERVGREREVGGLNVHIGQLSSELSESNAKVAKAEESQHLLMRKLEEERDAGSRALEAVQADLAQYQQKVQEIREEHVSEGQRRGAEVTQRQGLLTPVSATRFKDVEGYVQTQRGNGRAKKRPDSGIVILEEDEFDEDTIMADNL